MPYIQLLPISISTCAFCSVAVTCRDRWPLRASCSGEKSCVYVKTILVEIRILHGQKCRRMMTEKKMNSSAETQISVYFTEKMAHMIIRFRSWHYKAKCTFCLIFPSPKLSGKEFCSLGNNIVNCNDGTKSSVGKIISCLWILHPAILLLSSDLAVHMEFSVYITYVPYAHFRSPVLWKMRDPILVGEKVLTLQKAQCWLLLGGGEYTKVFQP